MSEITAAPLLKGAVIGIALNDKEAAHELQSTFTRAPYLQPPEQPVLYIKPRNTIVGDGALIRLPAAAEAVCVGATIAAVFSAPARRVSKDEAMAHIGGYTLAIDLTLPHSGFFRPPTREKCFDGACPLGPRIMHRSEIPAVDNLEITTRINDRVAAVRDLSHQIRSTAEIISSASAFMTFNCGDALLLGVPHILPLACAGDRIEVSVPSIGSLSIQIGRHR